MGDTSHVFLSHEGLEAESARTLARTLRASGIKVWLDVDDLKPGKLWASELEAALVRSSSFVIYIGTNGISGWVDRELRLAIDRNAKDPSFRIYPVLGHGAKPDLLPAFLQQHQWVDLRAPAQADNAIRTLVAELQGPAIPIAPEAVSQRCPFLGLLPFSAEDGALYFGRDAEVHSTLNALQDSSVVAVIGDSGSGKTSLIHAGVVPALQRGRFYSDGKWVHGWRVAICRPGESPFAEMANALPDLESDLSPSEKLKLRDQCELSLKVGPEGLANCLAMLSAPHDRHTLIVVDQFEELFTLSKTRESRLAFITSLVTAARSRGPYGVRLLLCLRSDFYPHCLEYEELVEWVSQHQVVLARPGQQQLRDVVEKPSKASSLTFESGLVDRILRDVVDEPGGLPMLGHALLQLWERRDGSSLTHRAYGDIGGVGGALKNHADAVFRGLSPEGQLFARKLLVRLTHVGVATVETRRRIPKDAILQLGTDRQLAEQVLNTLLAERLLVVTQAPTLAPQATHSLSLGRWQVEHDVIEVAHEALIRNWPLLQAWLDEDREAILIERRVHQAATEWLATERDPHQLYRGARLSQAEAWAEQYRGDVNADQSAFLVASRDQEDQDARDERTRRLRDKRRIQAVILLAVVAVVGFLVAAQQSLVARERMRITRAQDLADQAARTLEGRGDALRGLMYAVEAGRTAQTPPVWDALRRALRAPYVKVILRHGDQRMAGLSGVLFTPDGRFAITLGDGGGKIWDVKTGRQVHSLLPSERNLSRVALDHKGQVMAVPTDDGRLRLLDIASLAVLREWPVANGYLRDFVFAPDDARVATIGEDGIVRLWDSATGMLVRSLPRVGYATITFSPDGEKLATLSPDGITLWRISDGHVVARLRDVVCCVYSMSFSPDNSMFAGAARDGVVHLVSTTHGRDVHTFREAGEGWAYSTMFSQDGRLLVTGGYRGAKVWNVTTGAQLAVLPLQGAFQSMSVRPDGQQVVIATDQAAIVWNALDGLVSGTLTRFFENSLGWNNVSYSPDGELIAISAERGTARLWASDFESELPVLRGGTSDIVGASFSPDGSKIIGIDFDGVLRLWSADGALIAQAKLRPGPNRTNTFNEVYFAPNGRFILVRQQFSDGVRAAVWSTEPFAPVPGLDGGRWGVDGNSFSPDGTSILVDDGGIVRKIDLETRGVKSTFKCAGKEINTPRFSLDGTRIVAICGNETVNVFDARYGRLLREFRVADLGNPIFSPDARKVALVGNGVVSVWDVEGTRGKLSQIEGLHPEEFQIDWSPSGDHILVTQEGRLARVFDAETGRVLVTFRGHDANVTTARFSPDGQFVVTASVDGTARLWDAQTGQTLSVLRGHTSYVQHAEFSLDGRKILTASSDGSARQYYATFKGLFEAASARLPINLSNEEWAWIRDR
ncbi:MAG TPA: TIR domain-containing protein [Longimicrobium sp.]